MVLVTARTFTKHPEVYIGFAKQGETIVIMDGDAEFVLTRKEK